jgi:membrane fusion protein, multidrug efflux system
MNRISIPLFAALLFSAACSKQLKKSRTESAAPAAPALVRVAAAETRQIEKTISVTGALYPDETVTVSAEVPGRVARLGADFGQHVSKGSVIAQLDPREFEIQIERSRATLAQALARIGLKSSQENVEPETTPAIRQAQAQYEDARFKYESAKKLYKSGDFSEERYTEIEKGFGARQAALEGARDDLRTQLATIRSIQAEVRLLEKRLGDTTVRAPFDGSIAAKLAAVGQYMKEGTPIFTLVKTSPLRLRVEIPETSVAAARVGTALSFTTDAAAGAEFKAVVRELNPSLDARSRSLTVEARLASNDGRLKPGMFVQVRLTLEGAAASVFVPKDALYTVAGLTKVFVIQGDRVVEHKVPPGIEMNGWVEVPAESVKAGDLVAVSHLQLLIHGGQVKIARGGKG